MSPVLQKTFRRLALALPEAVEAPHFERTSFRAKGKIFATLDEASGIANLKLSHVDQERLCALAEGAVYPVPNKWGAQGWTSLDLRVASRELAADALALAYEKVGRKRKPSARRAR